MHDLDLVVDYSTREAAELAGLPTMTVDRLERAGIIASTIPAAGYGSRRRWSPGDVDRLCAIGAVYRQAHAEGLLVTWQAVGRIWDTLAAGDPWSVTLAA